MSNANEGDMRYELVKVEAFTIFGAPKLDPITVMTQDFGDGRGRLVIECYCEAWAIYWGAMGDDTVSEFVCDCSASYVRDKLMGQYQSRAGHFRDYTLRIVEAVQKAFRERRQNAAVRA